MSNTASIAAFDPKDFRRALGQFPTGVTIITTKTSEGEPIGVTASSFNSVSMDPPLVLWSVEKSAFSAEIMQNSEYFAVNVLSNTQVDMSNRFAGRGEDKFAGIAYTDSQHGSPLFNDCAAQFECKTWNIYEGGDHLIIVGEVIDYTHAQARAPLVFTSGSYAVAMQHPASVSNDTLKIPGDGLLGDYILYLLRIAYTRCSAKLYPELMDKHGIAPEEWRTLTLLGDAGDTQSEDIANMIGQPPDAFNATVDRMVLNGYLEIQSNGAINLSPAGKNMATRLFEIAKAQEEFMLSELTQQQRSDLKFGLQHIAKVSA